MREKIKNLTTKIDYFFSAKVFADMVLVGVIVAFIFAQPIILGCIVFVLIALDLRPVRALTRLSYKKSLLLYALPLAYVANIHNHDTASMYYINLGIVAAMLVIGMIYETIWNKVSKYNVLWSKQTPSYKPEKYFDIIYHYGFLVAIGVNIYNPVLAGLIFVGLLTLLAARLGYVLITKGGEEKYKQKVMNGVTKLSPQFAVFFSLGKPAYDVYTMWEKYFLATGKPFVVITPQRNHFEALCQVAKVPVLYLRGARDLEEVISAENMKAVFYPTNSGNNMAAMIPTNVHHVHIGHGDSDKATSFRSVTAMYDKIFVAGEEAIDRYARNGVSIPRDKFMIVGRPQIEGITLRREGDVKTVIYAPTWHGDAEATDYTSLYLGREIINLLLANNLRVIFRPHPNSRRSPVLTRVINDIYDILAADAAKTGIDHVYGNRAEGTLSIVGYINDSDVMISDVSSVVSDYLYSEKPIILIAMKESADEFTKKYPVARAAYVVEKDLGGLDAVIEGLVKGNDTLLVRRQELKERYLGKDPESGTYPDIFTNAVNDILEMPNPRNLGT